MMADNKAKNKGVGADDDDVSARGDLGTVRLVLHALYGCDRDELATKLFTRFGSLHGIFDATEAELIEMGLTKRAADFFMFASPFMRAVYLRRAPAHLRLSETAAVEFASRFFVDFGTPCDYIFVADADGTVRHFERIYGDPVRVVVGTACRHVARDVMWIRYRPREVNVYPDMKRLEQVYVTAKALYSVGIEFIDYIEYGAVKNYSLRREVNGETDMIDYAPDGQFMKKLKDHIIAKRRENK